MNFILMSEADYATLMEDNARLRAALQALIEQATAVLAVPPPPPPPPPVQVRIPFAFTIVE